MTGELALIRRALNRIADPWRKQEAVPAVRQMLDMIDEALAATTGLEEQLEALREVLREITATNWREIKDGVAYNQETPFQFEQRIHKIAADALMGVASSPASEPEAS